MRNLAVLWTGASVFMLVASSQAVELVPDVSPTTPVGMGSYYATFSDGANVVQGYSLAGGSLATGNITAEGQVNNKQSTPIASNLVAMPDSPLSGYQSAGTSTTNLGTFDIVINAGTTLAGNTAALAAFERAAALWESRISDPITVNISADMSSMGSTTIIGSASSVLLQGGYSTIRNDVVADAADEADDTVVGALPTSSGFVAALPTDLGLDGNVLMTKANLKALGATGLDAQFGSDDASITFNTDFSFDYDNSDGVASGAIDFETVAAHELGHALGFVSRVDYVDAVLEFNEENPDSQVLGDVIAPSILDLFRFADASDNPETLSEFTTESRNLVPGVEANTDQILAWGELTDVELAMSTAVDNGDGRQASHWKDNNLTGAFVGIMDPTVAAGQVWLPTEADYRALDLIGYEIAIVPEPASVVMLLAGVLAMAGAAWSRRRKR